MARDTVVLIVSIAHDLPIATVQNGKCEKYLTRLLVMGHVDRKVAGKLHKKQKK